MTFVCGHDSMFMRERNPKLKTKRLETYLRLAVAPDGTPYEVPVTVEVEYEIPAVPAFVAALAETEGAVVFDELETVAPKARVIYN